MIIRGGPNLGDDDVPAPLLARPRGGRPQSGPSFDATDAGAVSAPSPRCNLECRVLAGHSGLRFH